MSLTLNLLLINVLPIHFFIDKLSTDKLSTAKLSTDKFSPDQLSSHLTVADPRIFDFQALKEKCLSHSRVSNLNSQF